MHYKYKYKIKGQILDAPNEEISKLVTEMMLKLYYKYKDDEKIFPNINSDKK